MLRTLSRALVSALAAGVLLGLSARASMRLVTWSAGHEGGFSLSGTTFIVLLYVVVAVPGAVLAAFTSRRWRWVLPVAGALFLAVPAVGVARADLGTTLGFTALQWAAVLVSAAGVFATIAALPVVTVRTVDRLAARRRRRLAASAPATAPAASAAAPPAVPAPRFVAPGSAVITLPDAAAHEQRATPAGP